MELIEYYQQFMEEVKQNYQSEDTSRFEEEIFTERVMQYLYDSGITFEDPINCHHESKIHNANIKLSGYALSQGEKEDRQLDLFVSLYVPSNTIPVIQDSETKKIAGQCSRFLDECRKGVISDKVEPSSDVYALAEIIKTCFNDFIQIRIFVLTNGKVKSLDIGIRELDEQSVSLQVIDIERLYRYICSGEPQDDIVMDFNDYCGNTLPCVYVADSEYDYDCYLCSVPGIALCEIYQNYGDRLLEANVRSFLNANGKVNKGIRDTLRTDPLRFMAYNNGIVITANEVVYDNTNNGIALKCLKGMQIVNGGQTVATLFFTKKKYPATDLSKVQVVAKILLLNRSKESEEPLESFEENFIANVSKFSNSQNAVLMADLSSNKPFHIALEKLANTIYCPDGVTRWFYERSNGKYNVMIAREGSTPARLKKVKASRPTNKKISKTDFAKYMFAWDQKPYFASLGSQKNFEKFMEEIESLEKEAVFTLDSEYFKISIAKAILFRIATKTATKDVVPAFRANVIVYLVAMIALQYGSRINLDMIWKQQELSQPFKEQLKTWCGFVYKLLEKTSKGKMISEWAKKTECWDIIQTFSLPKPQISIPEIKGRF